MTTWIKDKEALEGLEKKEMYRLLCILMSPRDSKAGVDFKVDWSAAAQRFGAGSSESMRVNSKSVMVKVQEKLQDTVEDGDAADATPKATKASKTGTPKARSGTKRAAKGNVADDLDDADAATPKPKKARKSPAAAKTKKVDEEEVI